MSARERHPRPLMAQPADGAILIAECPSAAVDHRELITTLAHDQARKLDALARGICERENKLAACAKVVWLQNGLALLEAKKILPHGQFEAWCKQELSYAKSKAEKLMCAARVLGPAFESVSDTLLPPPTLAYALSASSIPEKIRDAFVPRMIAGETVEAEAWAAIRQHREQKRRTGRAGDPDAALLKVAPEAGSVPDDATTSKIEGESQSVSSHSALRLIAARLGNDLPMFLALAEENGPDDILVPHARRALEKIAQGLAGLSLPDAVGKPDCQEGASSEVEPEGDATPVSMEDAGAIAPAEGSGPTGSDHSGPPHHTDASDRPGLQQHVTGRLGPTVDRRAKGYVPFQDGLQSKSDQVEASASEINPVSASETTLNQKK